MNLSYMLVSALWGGAFEALAAPVAGFYMVPVVFSVLAFAYLPFDSLKIRAIFVWIFSAFFSLFWTFFITENNYASFYFVSHIFLYYLFLLIFMYFFYEDKRK